MPRRQRRVIFRTSTAKARGFVRSKPKTGKRLKRMVQEIHSGTRGNLRYECVGRHHEIILAIDDYQRRVARRPDGESDCELNREYLAITR